MNVKTAERAQQLRRQINRFHKEIKELRKTEPGPVRTLKIALYHRSIRTAMKYLDDIK